MCSLLPVSPEGVQVSDDVGPIKNGMTSPYAEGASLALTCSTNGGRPPPVITWKRDEQVK